MTGIFSKNTDDIAFEQAARAVLMYSQAIAERRQQAKVADAAAALERDLAQKAQRQREEQERRQLEIDAEHRRAAQREVDFVDDPAKLTNILVAFKVGDQTRQEQIRRSFDDLIECHLDGTQKIDFARLPFDGRLMFLPVYLGLLVGKDFPRFDFERSDTATGSYVYITHHGPADAAPWRESMTRINRYLGGAWKATELDGTSIKLWRLPDLPAVIPMQPEYLRKGDIFFGIDVATGQPYYVPLSRMTHTLVGGQSGAGKSVLLNQCLRSMLFNLDLIDELVLVDLKGGVELSRYSRLSPKIRFIKTYDELPALADDLVRSMYARLDGLEQAGELQVKSGFKVVVIDEFAAIQQRVTRNKEEKERHQGLIANLNILSQQGRAAGIRLWAQLQKPTADNMDTSFRTNLQSVLCFFMMVKANAAAMFGDAEGLPADPTALGKGEFIFRDDAQNRLVLLKATVSDETDIAGLQACVHPSHRANSEEVTS